MKNWILLLLSPVSAFALTLAPVAQPNIAKLPLDPNGPALTCDQIVDHLVKYNTLARQHDQGVISFLGQVTTGMVDWYAQLQPLEGKTQKLDVGTFSVLQDASNKINNVTDASYDNTGLLAAELDKIIEATKGCVTTVPKAK